MPTKADLNLIGEISSNVTEIRKDVEFLQQQFDQLKLIEMRERLAVMESQIAELKKVKEESDKRYWQFVFLFIGGLLTLAINVIVSFIRK